MAYHIDGRKVSLDDLFDRIEGADLVPSRAMLMKGISDAKKLLRQQGLETLSGLRDEIKNPKRLSALAEKTGIKPEYLTLLRREIEGYFPKPFPIKSLTWLPKHDIAKLAKHGICDTAAVYESTINGKARADLSKKTGISGSALLLVLQLSELTRVQWVNPTTAMMLHEAGCHGVSELAKAKADELHENLDRINLEKNILRAKSDCGM
jgi:hypothetical protein